MSMRKAFGKQGRICEQSPFALNLQRAFVACRVVSFNPGDRFRKAADNEEVYSVLKEALRLNVHCVVLQEAHGFVLDDAAWQVMPSCKDQCMAALFNRSMVDSDSVETIDVDYLPHKIPAWQTGVMTVRFEVQGASFRMTNAHLHHSVATKTWIALRSSIAAAACDLFVQRSLVPSDREHHYQRRRLPNALAHLRLQSCSL